MGSTGPSGVGRDQPGRTTRVTETIPAAESASLRPRSTSTSSKSRGRRSNGACTRPNQARPRHRREWSGPAAATRLASCASQPRRLDSTPGTDRGIGAWTCSGDSGTRVIPPLRKGSRDDEPVEARHAACPSTQGRSTRRASARGTRCDADLAWLLVIPRLFPEPGGRRPWARLPALPDAHRDRLRRLAAQRPHERDAEPGRPICPFRRRTSCTHCWSTSSTSWAESSCCCSLPHSSGGCCSPERPTPSAGCSLRVGSTLPPAARQGRDGCRAHAHHRDSAALGDHGGASPPRRARASASMKIRQTR